MIVTKVSYSRTYPIDLIWEKIFVEASLSEGENVRDALYECKRTVESFHFESNKADEKKKELPVIDASVPVEEDKEWNKIKKKLSSIEFKEDAQSYLDSTPYKLLIEAKRIVTKKPLKTTKIKMP